MPPWVTHKGFPPDRRPVHHTRTCHRVQTACVPAPFFSPPKPVKCLCLFLMLATRNSEDKETAVLTDCRHKCVNLGTFFGKKQNKTKSDCLGASFPLFLGILEGAHADTRNRGSCCSGSLARGHSARGQWGVGIQCIIETERET